MYQDDFSIAPLTLAAGSYFLILHNGDPTTNTTRKGFYWADTAQGLAPASQFQILNPFNATWNTNGSELSFQIMGSAATPAVPEPSAVALAGLAAVAVGLYRRASRKPKAA